MTSGWVASLRSGVTDGFPQTQPLPLHTGCRRGPVGIVMRCACLISSAAFPFGILAYPPHNLGFNASISGEEPSAGLCCRSRFDSLLVCSFLLLCGFDRSDVEVHANRASLAAFNGAEAIPLAPGNGTGIRVHDDASAPCLLGNRDGNSQGLGKQGVSQASIPKPMINGEPGEQKHWQVVRW